MGVDIRAIIGHQLSAQQLLELPHMLDKWSGSIVPENRAKWCGSYEMTAEILEAIWQDWEQQKHPSIAEVFDNAIHCAFGTIDVYRHTLIICPMQVRYNNLTEPDRALPILNANRLIAQNLNATQILYTTDSYYPMSIIVDKAQLGMTIEELIGFGIDQFGLPPKPVAEGVKYMFFIDEIQADIGELKSWNPNEDGYWQYNGMKDGYELKSRN